MARRKPKPEQTADKAKGKDDPVAEKKPSKVSEPESTTTTGARPRSRA
jgi:hypothetical protein